MTQEKQHRPETVTFFNFIFLPELEHELQKSKKQKSKNTYKLLKINTLNIFSFSLLHVAKNTEQRQSPGSWWLCLVFFAPLDLQFNTQFHKMLDPLPGHPLPIIYSSLFRRVCQRRTVQSARKQLLELTTVSNLSNRASLLSTPICI